LYCLFHSCPNGLIFMWLFPHVLCTMELRIHLWLRSRSKRNMGITFMCTCHAKTGKYGNEAINAYFNSIKISTDRKFSNNIIVFFFMCWCYLLRWIWCLWCFSECISTPGKLEKYAWPQYHILEPTWPRSSVGRALD
jgi:hypothetical protein